MAVPRLTIALPVYNGAAFLRPCVASILSQSFGDFELLILDNASSDASLEICQSFRDPRIRIYASDTNRGAAWNFNRGFSLARGRYFKWAACDDVLEPDFLRACVDALDADPEAVLAYTYVMVLDSWGRTLGPYLKRARSGAASAAERFREMAYRSHACHMVFGVIRREVLAQTGLIGAYFSSDRVLLAHLAMLGRFIEIPRALFGWRKHSGQSIELMLSPARLARWFDSNAQGRAWFPRWRMFAEYVKILRNMEFGDDQSKRACQRSLALWLIWKAPFLHFDLVRGILMALRPTPANR